MSCLHIYACQHILWEWQNVVINDTPAHTCNSTHPVEINTTVSEWRTNLYTLCIISLSLYIYTQYWLTGHKRQQQSKHVLVLKLLFQILSREAFVKACRISWIPMTCYIHIYTHYHILWVGFLLHAIHIHHIFQVGFLWHTIHIHHHTLQVLFLQCDISISIYLYLYLSIYHTIHIHHHTLQVLFLQCDISISIYLYLSIYHTIHIHHHTLQVLFLQCDIYIYLSLSIYHTIHIHHHTLQVLFLQCDIYIYLSIYIYLPISIYLSHYTYTSSHLAGFIPTMWYISIYLYLSIYLSITSCR